MKPQKRWQTRRSPMASKEKQFTRSKGLPRPATCSREKKTSCGLGFWICIRRCCSSTRGATLRRADCVLAQPDSSIKRCSPERPCSHIFFWRASPCRSESLPLRNRRRTLPLRELRACKFLCLPTRLTFFAGSLPTVPETALRLLRCMPIHEKHWKIYLPPHPPNRLHPLSSQTTFQLTNFPVISH